MVLTAATSPAAPPAENSTPTVLGWVGEKSVLALVADFLPSPGNPRKTRGFPKPLDQEWETRPRLFTHPLRTRSPRPARYGRERPSLAACKADLHQPRAQPWVAVAV